MANRHSAASSFRASATTSTLRIRPPCQSATDLDKRPDTPARRVILAGIELPSHHSKHQELVQLTRLAALLSPGVWGMIGAMWIDRAACAVVHPRPEHRHPGLALVMADLVGERMVTLNGGHSGVEVEARADPSWPLPEDEDTDPPRRR